MLISVRLRRSRFFHGASYLRQSARTFCARTEMSGGKVSDEVKDGSEKEATFKPFEQSLSGEFRPDYPWKKVKKCAAMLSFSGKNYHGMQRNQVGELKTIESELLAALAKAGTIDPQWEHAPQKAFFTRASRTDKGVSAARMVVSLKVLQEEDTVAKVNTHLPPDIRLHHIVRVGKNFNCQQLADARTYLYLTPTFAFSPVADVVTEQWRCGPDTIKNINDVFKHYHGVHYFHNFTSGKLPLEPSSQRYIMKFEAGPPFEKNGLEWSVITVKGQSFMIHQIRKMIGLAVAIARGHTGLNTMEEAWGMNRIDVPRAPGLGLMLDTVHFEKYNKRISGDGMHEALDWVGQEDAVEKFKEDFIFSDIMETEAAERSMMGWLGECLPLHTFVPRHFESDDREPSVLRNAHLKATKYAKIRQDTHDVPEIEAEATKDNQPEVEI